MSQLSTNGRFDKQHACILTLILIAVYCINVHINCASFLNPPSFELFSAVQIRCVPALAQDRSVVVLTCTVNDELYSGVVYYAIGEEVSTNSDMQSIALLT